ncbi:polysaccharide deacetylase family protein [Actinomycetaceae bacterium TAE3-ERU4]|nr:polysaccharide deacetylase family protein [Actinomycetaceae bacterium TAE3-ERU4]
MKTKRFCVAITALAMASLMAACSSENSLPGFREKTTQKPVTAETPSTPATPSKPVEKAKPTPEPTLEPGASRPYNRDGKIGPDNMNSPDGGPDCDKVKCVALTFDDGPGEYTGQVLDALKAAHVKGTFFELGRNVANNPEMTRRVVREGHALGGHSWNHPQLTKLSNEKANWQISATNEAFQKTLGVMPSFMRPPYGAANGRIFELMKKNKVASIMWSVDTLDWQNKDVKQSLENVHREMGPGAIILMHDIHPVAHQLVPLIVKEYRAKGYHFVTIPQMFKKSGLKFGHRYFSENDIRG